MKVYKKCKAKVLHISATSTGGVGYNLLMLARHIDKKKFELSFAIPSDSTFYNEIIKEQVKVYPLEVYRRPFKLKNLIGFYYLWRITRSNSYDIVHTHTSVGGLIGRLAARINNTPSILWTIHGWAFDYPYGTFVRRSFFKTIESFLDRFTSHYVAISENMKEVGVKGGVTHPEKVNVIYHGIEIEDSIEKDSAIIKKELGIEKDCRVIGTVGRFEPQKAMDDLLKAATFVKDSYPNIKLILVGDGPLKKYLERLAKSLDIMGNIIFTGWEKDVSKYIACMDVFCLSSLWEGFGIVLLEAMAAGKPIVATQVGGVPEIVEDRSGGILVPPGRPEELASGICLLLSNTEMRERMGHHNREKVKTTYNVKDMIKRYEALYEGFF